MKLLKSLAFSAAVCLTPVMALAGSIFDDVDDVAVVPEPAGALVMGVALVTVALVWRRRR